MTWADKVRLSVDWREGDQARLAELRRWLDPKSEEIVEDLAERVVKFNGAEPLMSSARFVQRLHGLLTEWLTGVVEVSFDEDRAEKRRTLGRNLADVNLSFEDVILLENMARERLLALAQAELGEHSRALSSTMQTLSKAMTCDRALVYAGCLDLHDAELEQALLDRFLTITGFSPTLYESLAEAWRWNQEQIGQRDV